MAEATNGNSNGNVAFCGQSRLTIWCNIVEFFKVGSQNMTVNAQLYILERTRVNVSIGDFSKLIPIAATCKVP